MQLESIRALKVLDLGIGMAAALVAMQLRIAGAQVDRIEPGGGDPFYDIYPAYRLWHEGSTRPDPARLEALAAAADICIVGGEDHPGLARFNDSASLAAANLQLIVLDIRGDATDPHFPAVDLLMQARSGHCYEQFSDRPIATAFPAPTYGNALLGLVSVYAALLRRERDGHGGIVSASLRQGAAIWWSGDWSTAERPDRGFDNVIPRDVRQLIFQCRDGLYVHMVLGTPGSVAKAYRALAIDAEADPADRGLPDAGRGPENFFFHDTDLFARHAALQVRAQLLAALWAEGIAAEAVDAPGAIWNDEQTRLGGFIETLPDGWRRVGSPITITAGDGSCTPSTSPPARPRIVDLGNFLAGPYASRLAADLGYDVIKVEPPAGDPNRHMRRSFSSGARGKRSIGVDAKLPAGLAVIRRLCASAQAVHHNFRPGVAGRLGLDPASLRALRADIVTMQSTAYGSTGPKALNSGFDMIMQACCGLEMHGAGKGNPPLWYRSPLVDYATGAIGTIALLMGLYEQARCGRSVDAESSLLGGGLFMLSELVEAPDGTRLGARALDAERTGFHPAERLYEARDGWIAVAARSPEMAEAFAACMGLGGMLGPRDGWSDEEAARIAAHVAPEEREALLARLKAAGVWAEACVRDGWAAALADPALATCRLVGAIEEGALGTVTFVDKLLDPALTAPGGNPPAIPALGEHTREVLGELGYAPHEIDALYAEKAVF